MDSMGRSSVVRVVGLSALLMAGSYLLSVSDLFHDAVYERHLQWVADGTAWLLGLLQLEAESVGRSIVAHGLSVRIAPGCDAILPAAMLASLIVPFPASWRWKLAGVLLGKQEEVALALIIPLAVDVLDVVWSKNSCDRPVVELQ